MNTTREQAFESAALALEAFEPALAAELRHGCLNINPGEPFFVLRAQDFSAPGVVDHWILLNRSGTSPAKIDAAERVADAMRRYSGPRKSPD